LLISVQKVSVWFQNNREVKSGVKGMAEDARLATTWTLRKVVMKEMSEDVNAAILRKNSTAHPGTRQYLRHLQDCITQVVGCLNKEKRKEFEGLAAAWNAAGVDADLQAK
jgi:hypothetical protein